jgi:hypothetical protein
MSPNFSISSTLPHPLPPPPTLPFISFSAHFSFWLIRAQLPIHFMPSLRLADLDQHTKTLPSETPMIGKITLPFKLFRLLLGNPRLSPMLLVSFLSPPLISHFTLTPSLIISLSQAYYQLLSTALYSNTLPPSLTPLILTTNARPPNPFYTLPTTGILSLPTYSLLSCIHP